MRAAATLSACLCACLAKGQQVEVTRYDVADGLPQSMVNHVLQDRDGFIWLGTGDGLARFDGHRWVTYKHDPRDSTSLSHNSIWGLAEKDARHLWVGTRAGLDVLDRLTGHFTHEDTGMPADEDGCWQVLEPSPRGPRFYSPLSRMLLLLSDGHPNLQHVRHWPSYATHADKATANITQVLGPDSLLTILPNDEERIDLLPNPRHERITKLVPIGDRWLMLTDLSAWTWSVKEGRRPLPSETQQWMDNVSKGKYAAIAPDGRIWVGHSGVGVAVLGTDLRILQAYPLLQEHERPLDITAISFDRQGNTWVGTDGKGVFKISPQRVKFGRMMPGQGLPWEPPSWFVRGFGQWDTDRVLVNFYQGGLALYDERTSALRPIEFSWLEKGRVIDPDRFGPLTDAQGALWLRDAQAVIAVEPGSGRLLLPRGTVHGNALAIGPDGVAVVLSRDGLSALPHGPRGISAEPIPSDNLRQWMQSLQTIPTRMAYDGQKRLFVCQPTIPIAVWEKDRLLPAGPFTTSARFTSIETADDGDVWMTSNEGLLRLDGADLSIKRQWSVHDGLPDQFLYGMLRDDGDSWWISTNKGLCRFDPQTEKFTTYSPADGLQSTEFNSGAVFRSASGRLYFGGVNGFNHFLPGLVPSDPDTAHAILIGLSAQDSAIDPASLSEAPSISLPYGRNQLLVDIAVLEMTAPERNRYRWRIAGYSDWSEHPADRPIMLTNMPAGEFLLEVAGINGDGLVSAPRVLLSVSVPLPFTASPWFFLLVGALIIGALGGTAFMLYRRRIRLRHERAERELKELRIRARIAHDLHDDVGSGLARITALARTAERKGTRGEDATSDVVRVRALSQELMQDLRDVVWVNDPRDGDLAALLLRIRDFTEDLFEPTGAICSFDFPTPLPNRHVGSQARRNLFLIAKEAAHNALKYSGASRITWRFAIEGAAFLLELSDNGKGMADGKRTSDGHGLRNMKARALELGAQLTIEPGMDNGLLARVAGPLSALDL